MTIASGSVSTSGSARSLPANLIVARRLAVLRVVREAFVRSQVSYSRVRRCVGWRRLTTNTAGCLAVHATGQQLDRIVSDTIRAVNADGPTGTPVRLRRGACVAVR